MSVDNGFARGKHTTDITVSMWLADIRDGLLTAEELYVDFPGPLHSVLDTVIPVELRDQRAYGLVSSGLCRLTRRTA